ncbi:hypothetical protein [Phormidesmis sp. 146-33]
MSEPELIYPTIDLFLYDLREGFGDDNEQVQDNRYGFWRKIYHDLSDGNPTKLYEKLRVEGASDENADARYVELLGSKRVREFESHLDGYYYPIQFGDTYALLVDCSGHKADRPNLPKPISELEDIKKQIRQQIQEDALEPTHPSMNELGRTWLILGQLVNDQQDYEAIAEKCYTKVVNQPNWKTDLIGTGKLLGAEIYELWQQSGDDNNEQAHVLICLFPHWESIQSIRDRIGKLYFDLMRLFCYRHKIIWAYSQNRQLRRTLKSDFAVIKQLTEQASTQVAGASISALQRDLTQALEVLSRYSPNLTALYYQGRTIAINLANYKKRLKKISDESPQTDLTFQTEFLEIIAPQYQREIEADHERFERGLALLQNLMEANRGRIELYQAARDRRFEQVIAIAGVGLATSQIAASILVAQDPPKPEISAVMVPAFWKSLVIGISFGVIVWCTIFVSQRFRRH